MQIEFEVGGTKHIVNSRPGFAVRPPSSQVKIKLTNLTETVKLDYVGWSNDRNPETTRATLRDEFGNEYSNIGFNYMGIGRVIGHSSGPLHPGKSIEDVLFFEPPIEKARVLTLELPKQAYRAGELGAFKLRFAIGPEAKQPDVPPQ